METKTSGNLVKIFSVGLLVGAFVGVLTSTSLWWSGNAESMQINVTVPNGPSLNLTVEGFTLEQKALLDKIYGDDFARAGLIGWLLDKRIFETSNPSLVEALNTTLCDPIPTAPLPDQIRAARQCAELPVALRLRELADQREIPFHYIGRIVQVGIPRNESNRPPNRRANVCGEGELRGRMVRLTNPVNNRSLEVEATGWYRCTGYERVPDIQLNPIDARAIFDGPFSEYQEAVAVILGLD